MSTDLGHLENVMLVDGEFLKCDGRILDGSKLSKYGEVSDVVGVLADLQCVFVGDVQQLLSSTVEVIDLMTQVVDLLLGVDPHDGSQNARDGA